MEMIMRATGGRAEYVDGIPECVELLCAVIALARKDATTPESVKMCSRPQRASWHADAQEFMAELLRDDFGQR